MNSYWGELAFHSLVKGRDLESCIYHFTAGSWQTSTCSRITKKPGLCKCLAGLIDVTFSLRKYYLCADELLGNFTLSILVF